MIEHLGIPVTDLRHQGTTLQLLLHRGLPIFINPTAKRSAGDRGGPTELPQMEFRIVEDGGEKWWECGFAVSADLPISGSAASGWTSNDGYWLFELERSENLTAWSLAQMTDCSGSPEDMGDGTTEYWSRSIFPHSSEIRTGQLSCASGPGLSPDTRNNPFTALTLDGTAVTLPNAPYTMPTHAAQLQTDIRSAGWATATVTASSATVWSVVIPNVAMVNWGTGNRISWAAYTITDPLFSTETVTVDGRNFDGTYVNAAGVRTQIRNQFFRLRITQLKA